MDLFISDLDGTLLNSKKVLSKKTIVTINKLIDHGVLFSIATARSRVSAGRIIEPLNLNLPQIFHNGAFIYDPRKRQNLVSELISSREASDILAVFHSHSIKPFVYTVDAKDVHHVYYQEAENRGEQAYLKDRLKHKDPRFKQVKNFDKAKTERSICIVAIQPEETLIPIVTEIQSRFHVTIHFARDVYVPDFHWLEICHKSATKEHAVQYVKEYLGAERLICFGDHINDLPMFSIADESYAVANAHEDILSRSDAILKSNDDNGVADFLETRYKGRESRIPKGFSSLEKAAAFISESLSDDNSYNLFNIIKRGQGCAEMEDIILNPARFYHLVFKPLKRQLTKSSQFFDVCRKETFPASTSSYSVHGSEWGLGNFEILFCKQDTNWHISGIRRKPL